MRFDFPPMQPLAADIPVRLDRTQQPVYGRLLEDFVPGTIFHHPRGLTIPADFALSFASTFMQANPLYLNEPWAKDHGFPGLLVSPLMTLLAALALGVQNDSERAIAHLGYYDVEFPRPVYAGDTLRSRSEVLSRRPRRPDEQGRVTSGIVRIRTQATNQEGQVVVRYERAVLIPVGDAGRLGDHGQQPVGEANEPGHLSLELPLTRPCPVPDATGSSTYFEDFQVGDIILHRNGRTITEEHVPWTFRLGNTHPLHYDRVYSGSLSGPMSGEPIVFGGFVFAWLEGLASRDVSENALWDLGYTEGYHTQPAVAGDTLYAISRVLSLENGPDALGVGVMGLQLIGVKNMSGRQALDQYGAALFARESTKPRQDRIPEKLFEIERRLLLKRRSAWV